MTDLQLRVTRILWKSKEASAADVQKGLQPAHDLAITTVSTLLNRMVKRGDVAVRRDGRQFFYSARVTEADVSARELNEVADLLYSGNAAAAIAHLVDITELDKDELRALAARIADKEKSNARKPRR